MVKVVTFGNVKDSVSVFEPISLYRVEFAQAKYDSLKNR